MPEAGDEDGPKKPSAERVEEHLAASFSKTAGQSEAVMTAWVGSLALFFIVALLPLQDTTRRIARTEAKVRDARATQARNAESRSRQAGSELMTLPLEVRLTVDQLVSLDVRRAQTNLKPGDDALGKQLDESLAKAVASPEERLNVGALRQRELNRRQELLAQAAEIRVRRSRDSAALVALRRQVTQTPTPIGDVPVPALLVPTAWLLFAGGLVTYVAMRRRALLSILARWIASTRRTQSPAEGLVTDAPFWLSPLPPRVEILAEPSVGIVEMTRFIGWHGGGLTQRIALGFCGIGGLVLTAWVGWIAFTMGTYHTDPHTGFRVTAVGILVAVCCWGTTAYLWFAPITQPAVAQPRMSRRHWLGVAVTSACGAYLLLPRGVLPSWATLDARRHRNRQRAARHQQAFAGAFCLHAGTGVVHYVSEAGIHSDGLDLTKAQLLTLDDREARTLLIAPRKGRDLLTEKLTALRKGQPSATAETLEGAALEASTPPLPTPRLLPSQLTAVLEIAALEARRNKNLTGAIELLRIGLPADDSYRARSRRRPSYRLYDLLATCLLEEKGAPGLDALIDHVRKTWPTDMVLANRILHWRKRASEKTSGKTLPPRKPWEENYTTSQRFKGLWRNRGRTVTARVAAS